MELKLLLVFLRRWAWLLGLGALLGAGAGYLISHYQTPAYRASTRVLITGDLNELDETASRRSLQELVGTYTQLLLTRSTSSLASERLGYSVNPAKINVRAIPNTKLFEVTYESDDPQRAAETVNVLVTVLIEQNDTLQSNRVISSASGLKTQIDEVKVQMEDLEEEIASIYQLTREQKQEDLSSQIASLETDIDNLQREILNLTVQYNEANLAAAASEGAEGEEVEGEPETPPLTLEQETTLEGKRSQLAKLESDLARFRQAHFDLTVLGRFEPGQNTDDSIRLNQAQTELELYRQLYSDLLSDYELARMTNLSATPSVVQVDPAVAPGAPLRPQPVANTIFAASAGLLLAGLIAFVVEYLDDSLKSGEEINHLFGAPVLGRIMYDRGAFKKQEVHAALHPRSPVTESLRSLRTNLEFAKVDQPLKSLLVTSANPSEGKTAVAVNLAAVMAQAGQHVLIVDADLRRPTLHQYFDIPNNVGLTSVLIDQVNLRDALHKSPDEYIAILPSGPIPPNPVELLRSAKMSQILEQMAKVADVIIIDGPPVVVADAPVLAAKVSGVLVVVRYAKTRKAIATGMVEQLGRVNARVVGVVLNSIKSRANPDYYYGRYYHYYQKGDSKNGWKGLHKQQTAVQKTSSVEKQSNGVRLKQ
ncbi:MAG: polysaccharide biosynthesis tyrosine autokinase [Chloroflexi bacterium]|nr:polysaccharide biosynthesis tyrosine autokinase [Chloroflexota bacterium]MCI0579650.1 polysaccharide biosynthesis tyrosine autokinase [Chloroflexota bacterium]MCI0645910.1 polysaccharide biosynthesis tyrosine autokinase [Chloroflexota bacterium]MCI0725765.1 polysaccharide biosynthesis tyrosine autokinase [Chloroflexota bacterium]